MKKACLLAVACSYLYAQEHQEMNRGDDFLQGVSPSYNAPAAVSLQACCDWNTFVTGSWIYWYAEEEGLDLATTVVPDEQSSLLYPIATGSGSKTFLQDFTYKSGFKAGIGGNCGEDGWTLRADWTRLHESTHSSLTASEGTVFSNTGWFYQVTANNQPLAGRDLSSRWRLNLDWVDLTLARSFYQGIRSVVTPFAGLRSSFIHQSMRLQLSNLSFVSPPTGEMTSQNRSKSWGVGPRAGVDARCLLGSGVRLQGEMGGSLLYTRYTTLSHKENSATDSAITYKFYSSAVGTVRPMLEANLGLGWGWYSPKKCWHVDLSATYDFNYLWAQNMIRVANDWFFISTRGAIDDLSMHGVTATATLSF